MIDFTIDILREKFYSDLKTEPSTSCIQGKIQVLGQVKISLVSCDNPALLLLQKIESRKHMLFTGLQK